MINLAVSGTQKMARKKLSTMETTVLGIAWKRGPCTTYALMKELASSSSTYYKSRAGTAYPLVERLITNGLLEYVEEPGARGDKLVGVTDAGLAELKSWISSSVDVPEVAHTVDFVRLRVFYLGSATPDERRAVIDGALAALQEHLDRCLATAAKYELIGDVFSKLATMGAVSETEARISWLKGIREAALAAPIGKP